MVSRMDPQLDKGSKEELSAETRLGHHRNSVSCMQLALFGILSGRASMTNYAESGRMQRHT